jgi:5-methylcytosine-specific restriction enzyme B
VDQRQKQRLYEKTIRARCTSPPARYATAYGFSNSTKVIEGGVFAFNANLGKLANEDKQLVVHCVIRFPTDEEVYFSVVIESGLPAMRHWVQEMEGLGTSKPVGSKGAEESAGEEEQEEEEEEEEEEAVATAKTKGKRAAANPYTDNSKNVKGFIGRDGRLYVRNKGFWNGMPQDLAGIAGGGFPISQILFAVWPADVRARKSLSAREFVGYIGSLIGPPNVHEVLPWPRTSAEATSMRMPTDIPLSEIEDSIASLGGHYPGGEIARLHASLNYTSRKHFAILSGLSGTGKTQLIQQYARAVHGVRSMTERDPLIFMCPVRPDWTDPTGLTGYPDVLTKKYLVPTFLEAVLLAAAEPESPVFVVLDEMNLARVEYYFADVLSCLETPGEVLRLHSNGVPMEGSNGGSVPDSLPLPKNLFIVGTVNVDETTHGVSDKVLDRAQSIEMSSVDLPGFLDSLATRETALQAAIAACRPQLLEIHRHMNDAGQGFGYRVAEEVVRYIDFATKLGVLQVEILDQMLVQKVLTKLRGTVRDKPMLDALQGLVAPDSRASNLLGRLARDLEDFGSFQASR